ncbi:site-specific integrase [Rhizobium bangladeshense]|uniref:site-specific integrase n=1 Tax=Rhizobium bangladeshense TaxID=1138189 RepID=UPI001C828AE6|nr:site-specific integrase [Rhizobium bangladeshense]MBX4898592.1 tyrosine-type recombinase/integrase [Rhizobium bangladeshense]MBY3616615.1 tyrosine-type recombinase/integrase [Rhizobium bangladeshense]
MAKKDGPINSAISAEITLSLLKRVEAGESEYLVSDTSTTGFAVRVRPSGAMSYVVLYRYGSGRSGIPRKYTIGSTKKVTPDEARRIAKTVLAEVVQGGDPAKEKSAERASPMFDTLKDDYLLSVDAKKKSSTYKLYAHWLGLASETLGRKKAKDVGKGDIEKLHVSMKDKPITANRVLSTISSMYTWGTDTKAIPKIENPASGITKYSEDSRERYLTVEELGRLGDAIREAETDGIQWDPDPEKKVKHAPKAENRRITIDQFSAAALRLFILTGARRGEILKLKWSNVDLQRGLLFLDDSKTRKKTIILNGPAQLILTELPKVGPYVIPGQPKDLGGGKIEHRPRSDLKRPWHHIRKRAGLDAAADDAKLRVRIHDLRHTHASVGVEANLSLQIIGKLLGHAQMKTTERYAHLADDPKRHASDLIGSKIVDAMGDRPRRENVHPLRPGKS